MSEIVWDNVVMFSLLSFGFFAPTLFLVGKLFSNIDFGVVRSLSKRNSILSRVLGEQTGKLRLADMSLSKLQLENSKLLSERKDLFLKVDDAVKRVDFIDNFFSQFFSSLDFEVVMALIDAYPNNLSTKDLGRAVEVSPVKVYAAADRLFKQKWLVKGKSKGFPKTNLWSLKREKFDLLSQVLQ